MTEIKQDARLSYNNLSSLIFHLISHGTILNWKRFGQRIELERNSRLLCSHKNPDALLPAQTMTANVSPTISIDHVQSHSFYPPRIQISRTTIEIEICQYIRNWYSFYNTYVDADDRCRVLIILFPN